jgi:hypothetical protein
MVAGRLQIAQERLPFMVLARLGFGLSGVDSELVLSTY